MSAPDRSLRNQVLVIVRRDTARTAAELAQATGATVPQVERSCWALCHLGQLDFAGGYFRASRTAAGGKEGEVSATPASPSIEVECLRAERDELRRMIGALVAALPDPEGEVRYRRQLCQEAAGAERERARSQGYAEAIADVKAAEHALPGYLRGLPTEAERWAVRGEPRTRATFGDPHPDDYKGGALPHPHQGLVWLGARAVHWHRPCTAACFAHKPGWYTPAEAAAILATLPGNYQDEIAALRSRAGRDAA